MLTVASFLELWNIFSPRTKSFLKMIILKVCNGNVMSKAGHPLTLQGSSRLNYSLAYLAFL